VAFGKQGAVPTETTARSTFKELRQITGLKVAIGAWPCRRNIAFYGSICLTHEAQGCQDRVQLLEKQPQQVRIVAETA
jgi:hypothetical protein